MTRHSEVQNGSFFQWVPPTQDLDATPRETPESLDKYEKGLKGPWVITVHDKETAKESPPAKKRTRRAPRKPRTRSAKPRATGSRPAGEAPTNIQTAGTQENIGHVHRPEAPPSMQASGVQTMVGHICRRDFFFIYSRLSAGHTRRCERPASPPKTLVAFPAHLPGTLFLVV